MGKWLTSAEHVNGACRTVVRYTIVTCSTCIAATHHLAGAELEFQRGTSSVPAILRLPGNFRAPRGPQPARRAQLARKLFSASGQDNRACAGPSRQSHLALATAAAVACGSTSSNTVAGPSPAKCQLTATNSTPSFKSPGGSGTINVVAARECAWSAAAQVSWLALAPPTDGQGEGTLESWVRRIRQGCRAAGP